MSPAARVGDMHTCPMVTPLGLGRYVPHVGGPVSPPGVPAVLIGGMPAATVGSLAACVGSLDQLSFGSKTVFVGGMPAVRQGDLTAHSGQVVGGDPTVLIGN